MNKRNHRQIVIVRKNVNYSVFIIKRQLFYSWVNSVRDKFEKVLLSSVYHFIIDCCRICFNFWLSLCCFNNLIALLFWTLRFYRFLLLLIVFLFTAFTSLIICNLNNCKCRGSPLIPAHKFIHIFVANEILC